MSGVSERAELGHDLAEILGISLAVGEKIVQAFDEFVARPLESNLRKLTGRDLARRNPMIYTARGTTTVDEWVDRVLADREPSAIEATLARGWKKSPES